MKKSLSMVICLLILATALSFAAQEKAITFNVEEVIAIPGSNVTLQLGAEQFVNGEMTRIYEIYRDGQLLRQAEANYELGLRYAHFDPALDLPQVDPFLMADEDVDLYIVQFVTQPLEEFQRDITNLGGAVRHYMAQFAYLVEMDNAVAESVSQLPYVRWIGQYQPAYRLDEETLQNLRTFGASAPAIRYNIQVLDVAQKAVIVDRIRALGAGIDNYDAGKKLVEATLNGGQLLQVARFDEVNFIDVWGAYEADMDIVRQIGGANFIETVAGFTGEDVRGEIFDGGCQFGHQEFQLHPIIQHGPYSIDSHGTACMGVNFATGVNPLARGLLPDGQGIFADYSNWGLSGTNRYVCAEQLVNPTGPFQGVFQTSSVGPPRTTQYTTISAEADEITFDFNFIACQSQSNAGTQNSRPQAWAKNYVSGGALYHYNTLDRSDDMWNYGASIGPASDGRVGVSFTHFYDQVFTTYTTSTTGYGQFSGTSNATPCIAGHFGLFFEMWDAAIFGNTVNPTGSVFENRCKSTTAKAMIIATAYQYDFTGTTHDKTRTHQGWGMPDVQKLYNMREKIYFVDETDVLNPFGVGTHNVTIDAGEPELKIAMVYLDPAGNPAVQAQHRINDLTLKVISPSSVVYWGNNNLYLSPHSTAGGAADTKNTEECVFLLNPEAGEWTIEVHADEIIQDGHVETTELDADYALVVSGIAGGTPPEISIDLTYLSGSPVSAGGGAVNFDIVVENMGATPYIFDAWTDISLPTGGIYTVIERPGLSLGPGASILRNLSQNIPANAPPGNYTYNAFAGSLPFMVFSEDHFDFEKLTDGDAINPDNSWNLYGWDAVLTTDLPAEFTLLPAYPNPFNPETTIAFALPEAARISLAVYDIQGREVVTLVDGWVNAGISEVTFNAEHLPSGVYFANLVAGSHKATMKLLLVK